jgi:DNA-directed RNA polymerase specialized sigma24 family protein
MNYTYPFIENLLGPRQNDVMLLDRIRNHDENVITTLCDTFGPIILGYVNTFFQSADDREDILHDILLELWNRPQSLRAEEESIYRWVIFSARRRIIAKDEEYLTENGSRRLQFEDIIQRITSAELGASESAPSSDVRRIVASAFFTCSIEHQRLLTLAFFLGKTCEGIGAEIHHPVDTVRFRIAESVVSLYSAFSALRAKIPVKKCQYRDACALFAVGESDPESFKEFYAHLQTNCEICREEISHYRDVLSLLPLMLRPVQPSPEFKERVLFSSQLALVMKANAPTDEPVPKQLPPENGHSSRMDIRFLPTKGKLLIGGLLFVIVVLTGYLFFVSEKTQQLGKEVTEQHDLIMRISENIEEVNDILEVLNAPDLRMMTLQGTDMEKYLYGKIFYSAIMHASVLQVANLPVQPDDKEYRVWMHAGKTMYLLHKFTIQKYFTKNYLTRFESSEPMPITEGIVVFVTLESVNSQLEPKGKQYLIGMTHGKNQPGN